MNCVDAAPEWKSSEYSQKLLQRQPSKPRCLGHIASADQNNYGRPTLPNASFSRKSVDRPEVQAVLSTERSDKLLSRPDQSITFLRSFGYSVQRTPKAGTTPLLVYHRKGRDLDRLGSITDLLAPGTVPVPAVITDASPGLSIDGKESGTVNASIGVTILGSIIRAMGGSDLGLAAQYEKARTVVLSYADVMEDRVERLQLEQFVHAARIRPENAPGLVEKLLDDEIYVVTATLKSKKFVVKAQDGRGMKVDLDVPVIKQAVGGNVNVVAGAGLNGSVVFEGTVPVVFGVQAVQLVFSEDGRFMTTEQLRPGDAAVRGLTGDTEEARPKFLEVPGAFARFND
jgi:hypothetical protein